MSDQFNYEVTLNNEAIPYMVRIVNGEEYFYIYAYGNKKFQCPRLRNSMSERDSASFYVISQRNKKNKAYYGKSKGDFIIENKKYFFMEILFNTNEEKEWATWLVPKEYTKRINAITHDFDDRS